MKNISFTISYLGDNPPTLKDIETIIYNSTLDDEGILTVDKVNPLYEICDYCNGTGNEGSLSIDCGNCGGSGWIKK